MKMKEMGWGGGGRAFLHPSLLMAYSDRTYVGMELGLGPEWVTVYYVSHFHTATYVGT